MLDERTAAQLITERTGININPDHVVKLPKGGNIKDWSVNHMDIFAVRDGEFGIMLFAYDDGSTRLIVH